MLNVIHSRQKRERRRSEADTLLLQCKDLEEVNDTLKRDNSRLEGLLSDANRRVALVNQGLEDPSGDVASSLSPSTPQDPSEAHN